MFRLRCGSHTEHAHISIMLARKHAISRPTADQRSTLDRKRFLAKFLLILRSAHARRQNSSHRLQPRKSTRQVTIRMEYCTISTVPVTRLHSTRPIQIENAAPFYRPRWLRITLAAARRRHLLLSAAPENRLSTWQPRRRAALLVSSAWED